VFEEFLNFDSSYEESKFILIPVPMELTVSYGKGTANGPAAIINSVNQLESYDVELDKEAITAKVHTMKELKANDAASYIDLVRATTSRCIKDGKIPVVLGGEHSLSYGVFLGIADHYDDISVVHFDSHLDLRDQYEGSVYSHASVMRRIASHPDKIDSSVSIGIRSVSPEEASYVKDNRSNVFYAHQLYDKNYNKDIDALLGKNVFITFDIDALDPSILPSTGTPEPGGLMWYQTLDIIKTVMKGRKILGFDIVELAPDGVNHYSEFTTAKLLYKMIAYTLEYGKKA
jgi:agmatinase